MSAVCELCNGSKHRRVKQGEGTTARWAYVACKCVLRERLKAFLGPFATAPKIEVSPLVDFGSKNVFCGIVSIETAKSHIAHFLRRQGLRYVYKVVDISALASMYVSGETDIDDSEYFKRLDLLIVFLNLVSLRSNKADDLLTRALSWRHLVAKPVWIFTPESSVEFQDKFRQAHAYVKGFERVRLDGGAEAAVDMDAYGLG